MDIKDDNEIDYVAGRYKRGCLDVGAGWKRLRLSRPDFWHRYRAAAAVAAAIVLSAGAAVFFNFYDFGVASEPAVKEQPLDVQGKMEAVKAVDFEDAPLTEVAERIEQVYGVKVVGLPADADSIRLSLHFEGNVAELVEMINDILNTQLTIES